MTTAWAHLPNAALIDAVLADVTARPDAWQSAWTEVDPPRRKAWDAAWETECGAAWDVVWRSDAAGDVAKVNTADAVWDVLLALVAWDDCAHLLNLPSTTLRTMADLCDAPTCHQALLLMPYAVARESAQEPCRQVTPA